MTQPVRFIHRFVPSIVAVFTLTLLLVVSASALDDSTPAANSTDVKAPTNSTTTGTLNVEKPRQCRMLVRQITCSKSTNCSSASPTQESSANAESSSLPRSFKVHALGSGEVETFVITDDQSKTNVEVDAAKIEKLVNDNDANTIIELNVEPSNSTDGKEQRRMLIRTNKIETSNNSQLKGDAPACSGRSCKTKCVVRCTGSDKSKSCTMTFALDSLDAKVKAFSDALAKLNDLHIDGLDKLSSKLGCIHVDKIASDSSLHIIVKTNGDGTDKLRSEDLDIEISGMDAESKNIDIKDGEKVQEIEINTLSSSPQDSKQSKVMRCQYVIVIKDGAEEHPMKISTEQQTDNNAGGLSNLSLKPNPTNQGRFRLGFTSSEMTPAEITISALDGTTVYRQTVGAFVGQYEDAVDLSAFAKGVYIVRVVQGQHSQSMKMISE